MDNTRVFRMVGSFGIVNACKICQLTCDPITVLVRLLRPPLRKTFWMLGKATVGSPVALCNQASVRVFRCWGQSAERHYYLALRWHFGLWRGQTRICLCNLHITLALRKLQKSRCDTSSPIFHVSVQPWEGLQGGRGDPSLRTRLCFAHS